MFSFSDRKLLTDYIIHYDVQLNPTFARIIFTIWKPQNKQKN